MRTSWYVAILLMFILSLAAVACGDDSNASTGDAATVEVNTAAQPAGDAVPAASTGKLSANDASIAELRAGFEAAGISNASKWAREVDEYRPYDVADTGYSKLRGELAKYNPSPGVVDAIIAQLELP